LPSRSYYAANYQPIANKNKQGGQVWHDIRTIRIDNGISTFNLFKSNHH
jgi:hypothetical protein